MTFYFAWVTAGATTFSSSYEREDEEVVSLEIAQTEGEFATLSIEIVNPREGLLAAGRKQWAWLSRNTGTATEPLFFGRLIGIPTDSQGETVTLTFLARPVDFVATRDALAETLKETTPYWDPLWIEPERRDDPDAVLEARSALWHTDRVTHAVSISDVLEGESGTIDVGGDFFRDSLTISYGSPPVRAVRVVADLHWEQTATGTIDLTNRLVSLMGGSGGKFQSLTGEGLVSEWPRPDARIGAGWSVAAGTQVIRTDLTENDQDFYTVSPLDLTTVNFPVWTLRPTFKVRYDVSRQRQERIRFTMIANVQRIVVDPGDDDVIDIALSSQDVGTLGIDDPATRPIGDLRQPSFMLQARGRRALHYLLCLARAKIRARARAVEISFECPFDTVAGINCKKNVTIEDPRLPGGTATGKVIGYRLTADGDSGTIIAQVTIGCSVGITSLIEESVGIPQYVGGGYVVPGGYDMYGNATVSILGGEIGYTDYQDMVLLDDDGVNFFQLAPANAVVSATVTNTIDDQYEAIDGSFPDASAAFEALNEAFSEITFELLPLTGGPFFTLFAITTQPLSLPEGIDLTAGSTS